MTRDIETIKQELLNLAKRSHKLTSGARAATFCIEMERLSAELEQAETASAESSRVALFDAKS